MRDDFSLDVLLSRLLMFLPFLRSPTLNKITIAYDPDKLMATSATPGLWRQIDGALASRIFERLGSVVISWPRQFEDENWRECLELTSARGILRFEEY